MSVMDIFHILFKVDNAEQTTKQISGIEDVTKGLGMAVDDAKKSFLSFGGGLGGMLVKFTSFAGVMGVILGQIHGAFAKIPEIQDLNKQANRYGTNAGDLDLYQRAMVKNGATADDAAGLIKQLNDTIAGTGHGAKLAQAGLNSLGIATKNADGSSRDMVSVLRDVSAAAHKGGANVVALSDQFRKMGLTQAEAMKALLAGKMTLSDAMEKQKELGYWTHETTQNVLEYSKAQGRLNTQLKYGLTQAILNYSLPALTKILNKVGDFIQFLRDHETFTKSLFLGIAAVIGAVLMPAIISLTAATARWLVMFAASPIGMAIMGVVALAAAFDDVYHYIEGGNSALGDFLANHKKLKKIVDTVLTKFRDLYRAIEKAFDGGYPALNKFAEAIKTLGGAYMDTLETEILVAYYLITGQWSKIPDAIKGYCDRIQDVWNKLWGKGMQSPVTSLFNWIKTAFADFLSNFEFLLDKDTVKWVEANKTHLTAAQIAADKARKEQADKNRAEIGGISTSGELAAVNGDHIVSGRYASSPQVVIAGAQANLAAARNAAIARQSVVNNPYDLMNIIGSLWHKMGGGKQTINVNAPSHNTISGVMPDDIIDRLNTMIKQHEDRTTAALISGQDSAVIK